MLKKIISKNKKYLISLSKIYQSSKKMDKSADELLKIN